MAKKTINKDKSKKKRNSAPIYFVVLSLFSIFIGFFLYFLFDIYFAGDPLRQSIVARKKLINSKVTDVKLATPKPSPTKSTVFTIPQNSGRSVRVPIFYFHYIGNNPNPNDMQRDALSITPDRFEAEMSYLSNNGYNAISLDTLYAALKGGSLPLKPVALTFDDGYIDFYLNAYPILRKYNLRSTVFIPTGLINQGYYLSWSQIRELDASNLVSFEAHTVNHDSLGSLNIDQLKYQVFESKKVLEAQLGKKVNFFAYPYGVSNPTAWEIVKEAGFLGAFGTWASPIESEGNIFDMPRIRVGSFWGVGDFAARL